MVPCDVVASITLPGSITNSAFGLSGTDAHEQNRNAMSRWKIFFISLQNASGCRSAAGKLVVCVSGACARRQE